VSICVQRLGAKSAARASSCACHSEMSESPSEKWWDSLDELPNSLEFSDRENSDQDDRAARLERRKVKAFALGFHSIFSIRYDISEISSPASATVDICVLEAKHRLLILPKSFFRKAEEYQWNIHLRPSSAQNGDWGEVVEPSVRTGQRSGGWLASDRRLRS
jgi:hypothetical protein